MDKSDTPFDFPARFTARAPLRERLRNRETIVGSFVFLSHPSIIEILAEAGLDLFIIDMEHSPKNWETVENMLRAAEIYGVPAVVRVAENKPETILAALELGAAGVAIPFVESAEDVRKAADAVRYFPEGKRGTCTQTRSARHGAFRKDYVSFSKARNRETVLIGLIENRQGLAQIDAIVSEPNGLDCVLLGRADLASDLGVPGQSGAQVVVEASDAILAAVENAARKGGWAAAAAMAIYGPGDVARWRERGCTVFVAPSESSMLLEAAQAWRTGVHAACVQAAGVAA